MDNNFDLKKFLVENRLTSNSKVLSEVLDGLNRSDKIDDFPEDKLEPAEDTLRELKPEKYKGSSIPSHANYRIVYMYSGQPKYEMFTRTEPSDHDMKMFAKLAPEKFEIEDGILALDRNNKQVNFIRLLDNKGFFRRPGDLMPMTM